MEISLLYQKLIEFGYVFKCENGKVEMKAGLICNNDPRHESWRNTIEFVTETKWDNERSREHKKSTRKELINYVRLVSTFSEKTCVQLLLNMHSIVNELGWTGEELAWCREHNKNLYELQEWYEKDIDICFMEGDMIEFNSTVQMYYKCLVNIWREWNWEHGKMLKKQYEDEAEEENPWTNKYDYQTLKSIKSEKTKRGKRGISDIWRSQSMNEYYHKL